MKALYTHACQHHLEIGWSLDVFHVESEKGSKTKHPFLRGAGLCWQFNRIWCILYRPSLATSSQKPRSFNPMKVMQLEELVKN